jgi:RNA exonuclease NGL2
VLSTGPTKIYRTQEFLHYAPTIACLQEVDRLDHHEPVFRKAGYDFVWQKGYAAKLHGLCIAWKEDVFEKAAEKLVKLDDATFDPRPEAQGNIETQEASISKRTACSRATRNTGLFVALRWRDKRTEGKPQGIIIVTRKRIKSRISPFPPDHRTPSPDHLFWHARHQYERARQVAVLLREIDLFRQNEDNGQYKDWPCFFAGGEARGWLCSVRASGSCGVS